MWLPHALVCDNQGAAWWCSQCSHRGCAICRHLEFTQNYSIPNSLIFCLGNKAKKSCVLFCAVCFIVFFLIKNRIICGKFVYCNCWKDFFLESLCAADILVLVDITNRGSTDISALLKLGFLPARVSTFCLQQSLKAVFQTTHFLLRGNKADSIL